MRLRKALFVCALVLVMPLIRLDYAVAQEAEMTEAVADKNSEPVTDAATLEGAEKAAPRVAPVPVPTPIQLVRRDVTYASAYKDVYKILSGENPCSKFFGGPLKAVDVLNGFFGVLETSRMASTKVGLTMSGRTRNVRSARTGASYRLFEKALINTNGPFYQRKFSTSDPFVPNVGSFQPNTREARAAILLHEMGHLVQGTDGRWLLPNDGSSDEQSRKNTATIEIRCGDQIRELQRGDRSTKAPEKGDEPAGSK